LNRSPAVCCRSTLHSEAYARPKIDDATDPDIGLPRQDG
jgi:hypothetical protein